MDTEIIQHRMARGVIVEGASGILASEWTDLQSRLDALEANQIRGIIAGGQLYGPLTTLAGYDTDYTRIASAKRLSAMPFIVPADATFDELSIWVNVAGSASATVRVGIYAPGADGLPAVLTHDFGTITAASTGLKTIPIDLDLPRGLCWVALAASETVSLRARQGSGGQALVGHSLPDGTSPGALMARWDLLADGFSAFPATFGSQYANTGVFLVWFRAA